MHLGTHPAARPSRVSRKPQEVRVCRNPVLPGCMPADARSRYPEKAAMIAIAAMAPSTPTLANIVAPAREACAAPARNNTALSSIHTTIEGGLNLRVNLESCVLT